ncbi:MAG TPA: hypothetical protein VFD49_05750 [Candidatus Dormibacteraeota bacterium]|nr:hypothetical protein [Candidatus Dormibacteraeota bacterium]
MGARTPARSQRHSTAVGVLSPVLAPRLRGRKVALICTGANLSPAQLRDLMASG